MLPWLMGMDGDWRARWCTRDDAGQAKWGVKQRQAEGGWRGGEQGAKPLKWEERRGRGAKKRGHFEVQSTVHRNRITNHIELIQSLEAGFEFWKLHLEDMITQLECIPSSIIRYLRQIQAVRRLCRSMNLLVRCALATTFILLYDDYKRLANIEGKGRHSDVRSGHGTRGRLSHYWRTRKPVLRLRSWKAASLCLRHSSNHQDITRLKNVLWQFWDRTLLFLAKFWKGRCDVDNFYILLHQDFEELEVQQLATASGSEQRILSCVNQTLIEWSVSKSEFKWLAFLKK